MKFTNKAYDTLKWIAQYLLPGMGTLYFALAKVWNLPYGEEIVGTISAVDIFLGTLLGISSHNYDGEGSLVYNSEDAEDDTLTISLNEPLDEVLSRESIVLKVEK